MNRFTSCMYAAIFAFTIVIIADSKEAGADDVCNAYFHKNQTTSKRTVFLTDGNALDLFQKYLDEAGKKSLKVDPWKLKVVLVSNKEKKEFSANWVQMLTGQGAKERWTAILKNIKADADEAVYKEAVRQQWDIVCYGNEPSKPATQAQQAQQAQPAVAGDKTSLEAKQHFQQAMQYASRRDFANAVKEFTNALQKQPSYAAAYSNRGVAYMQQKKFDLAEDDLKKAVELGPKDGKNHYNLACWYSLQNQAGRGISAIDAALSNGFNDYDSLRKDRDLANLRKSPDWQKLLDKHKIFLTGGK